MLRAAAVEGSERGGRWLSQRSVDAISGGQGIAHHGRASPTEMAFHPANHGGGPCRCTR